MTSNQLRPARSNNINGKIKPVKDRGIARPMGSPSTWDGQEVSLSSYWADGPIFMTFLRHWWNSLSRLAGQLGQDDMEATGLQVVAVGWDNRKHAPAAFRRPAGLSVDCGRARKRGVTCRLRRRPGQHAAAACWPRDIIWVASVMRAAIPRGKRPVLPKACRPLLIIDATDRPYAYITASSPVIIPTRQRSSKGGARPPTDLLVVDPQYHRSRRSVPFDPALWLPPARWLKDPLSGFRRRRACVTSRR